MEDRPWSEWKHGKPISKAGLARLLKPYQICPRTVRFDSGSTAKGYHLSQFADANARYANSGDSADTPFQTVTPSQMSNINDLEQFQNVTRRNDVTFSNPDNPLKNNDCDGVTFCEGGYGASVSESGAEQADVDERAAVLEHEAGLPRSEAEAIALDEVKSS